MPYIQVKTTALIDDSKKELLNTQLCQITKECLGKGENWVMTGYENQADLMFQGSDKDVAYVEVKAFGNPDSVGADKMTAAVCALIEKELSIPAERTYVSYWATDKWGWNGNNF